MATTFGTYLRHIRLEHGISISRLATHLGVHSSTPTRWEYDDTLPIKPTLDQIVAVFNDPQLAVLWTLTKDARRQPTTFYGAMLRRARLAHHETQYQLADAMMRTQVTISEIERGLRLPGRPLANALAARYHEPGLADVDAYQPPCKYPVVAQTLRTYRQHYGQSRADVATTIRSTIPAYTAWEQGRTRPARRYADRLAALWDAPHIVPYIVFQRVNPATTSRFAILLRDARVNRHRCAQTVMAERLGVSRELVSQWENDRSRPPLDRLEHLATIYQIPYQTLEQAWMAGTTSSDAWVVPRQPGTMGEADSVILV